MRLLALAAILPVVGAVIGYVTKRTAITLLFWPPAPRRFGPIRWQGVIQRRAPKLAGDMSTTLTGAAVDNTELADRVDSSELARHVEEVLLPHAGALAQELSAAISPGAWSTLDEPAKLSMAAGVASAVHDSVEEIIDEQLPAIANRVNLNAILEEGMTATNGDALAQLLRRIGSRELQVLIWYGAALGFVIGALQVGIYVSFEEWWILPGIGMIDGLVNNWLAIQMIFLPRERWMLLGVLPLQGLFPARREQIAADFATFVAEVVTPARIGEQMVHDGLVLEMAPAAMDTLVKRLAPAVGSAGSAEAETALTGALVRQLPLVLPAVVESVEPFVMKALDLRTLVEERLVALDHRDFERLLRGMFEQDEAILVGLGGVLGLAIGTLEAGLVVGLGL